MYTPRDTTIVTPNSDTLYSFVCMDLRTEPFVLSLPEIEKSRYYSVQLIDMYTFNYGYMGSRTTGNAAGNYMVVGPAWKGRKPEGIAKIFRCETDFSIALFRTQLFDAADLDNVEKIQSGYKVQPSPRSSRNPRRPPPPRSSGRRSTRSWPRPIPSRI